MTQEAGKKNEEQAFCGHPLMLLKSVMPRFSCTMVEAELLNEEGRSVWNKICIMWKKPEERVSFLRRYAQYLLEVADETEYQNILDMALE